MKSIAFLFLIFLLSSSFTPQKQNDCIEALVLNSTTWRVGGGCLENEDQTSFSMYSHEASDNPIGNWGYFISFTDKSFKTTYRAQCGVDCFTSVTGTYKLLGNNKIKFYVEDISRGGFCSLESESPKKSFGVFSITHIKNGLTFTKMIK
ncbi:MAG TPA: hypothetical protein EYO58_08780 [Flavobacteriales bacterium]|nr:hypothetical protein [Flavobacteriales bacterium]